MVINETSDNPGGGTPGDGTHLLRAMVEAKLSDACFGFIVDPAAAEAAHQEFVARFQKGRLPSDIPEFRIEAGPAGVMIGDVLTSAGLSASNSEAFRMIKQGAVRVDDQRVEDRELQLQGGHSYVVQVGKRRVARVAID